jgi:hypothetical protein
METGFYDTMPFFHLMIYTFTLWLGLYLLARSSTKLSLRYTGMGLISYALCIALVLFSQDSPHWLRLAVMLPAVFWLGAILHLLPDVPISDGEKLLLRLAWPYAFVVFSTGFADDTLSRWMSFVLPLLLLMGLRLRFQQAIKLNLPRPPLLIMGIATLFFLMSAGLVLLPQDWLRQDWMALTMSVDLLLLGYAVAMLDAYDEGHSIRRDSLRSLMTSVMMVLIVAGQAIVVTLLIGVSQPLLILIFGLISTVLVGVTYQDTIQTGIDRLILRQSEATYRENLRSASNAVIQTLPEQSLIHMDDSEFNRITRRAISYYTDLNKLAASPLIQLPCLTEHNSVLERTHALKALIRHHIEQLKPDSPDEFSTQEEWRYYNVLYFPYIRGLKPYSRRYSLEELTPAEAQALAWFQAYVPERTLYNWQKSAADLVGQALRDSLNPASPQ